MADPSVATNLVLKQEGGYVNDPRDPGGETNWGISKRAYPSLVIGSLTRDDAIAIYQRDYWEFDKINNQRLANLLMSLSVNMGKVAAIGLLQKSVGTVCDGILGPMTLHLANTSPDALADLGTNALLYYFKIALQPGKATFLRGWVARVLECLT